MNHQPLRDRIVCALRLSPMSIDGVALCLSVTPQTAQQSLTRLCKRGQVRRRGWEKRRKGYAQLFEVAA